MSILDCVAGLKQRDNVYAVSAACTISEFFLFRNTRKIASAYVHIVFFDREMMCIYYRCICKFYHSMLIVVSHVVPS